MPKVVFAAALLAAFALSPLYADEAEDEAQCRTWAQEDEVPTDQLDGYMVRCMEDMRDGRGEASPAAGDDR